MKFLRYITIGCLVLATLANVSCKKDDDDDTTIKNYFSGTLSYSMPKYVYEGDVIHIAPTGIYMEDEADTLYGFKWTNPFTSEIDTLRLEGDDASVSKEFDLTIDTNELGSYILSVSAFADGYYDKTVTSTFVIVDPALGSGSLSGYDFLGGLSTFTDSRDGKEYYYASIAGKDWMIQNLAWNGAGKSMEDSEAIDPIFGRFYDWNEAATACPAGWSLPSDADYEAIAALASGSDKAAGSMMVDAYFNGSKMWEFWPAVKISNDSRFSAIPVGYYSVDGDARSLKNYGKYAFFWTSDVDADGLGVARYIYHDQPSVFKASFGNDSIMGSVRCVR